MSKKLVLKLLLDAAMLGLYLVLLGERVTDTLAHEIMGVSLFALFGLHNLLGYKWYRGIAKGKYTAVRVLNLLTNCLFLAFMLLLAVSSMMISWEVYPALNFGNYSDGRMLHTFAAHWGLLLMGFHLGLHARMIMGGFRKMFKLSENKIRAWTLRVFTILICGIGIYSMIAQEMFGKLFLQTTYALTDFPFYVLYPEFLSVALLFAAVGHYAVKLCTIKRRKNDEKEHS